MPKYELAGKRLKSLQIITYIIWSVYRFSIHRMMKRVRTKLCNPSLSVSLTHTHTHAHYTHAYMQTSTHTHYTHTHTHTLYKHMQLHIDMKTYCCCCSVTWNLGFWNYHGIRLLLFWNYHGIRLLLFCFFSATDLYTSAVGCVMIHLLLATK